MGQLSFDSLIGKVLLVGLTYYTHDNIFLEQRQYWGTVIESSGNTIDIRQKNGEIFELPADFSAVKPAPPGEYRLRSTGEIIINPDFLTTWTVMKAPEETPGKKCAP